MGTAALRFLAGLITLLGAKDWLMLSAENSPTSYPQEKIKKSFRLNTAQTERQ